MPDKPPLGGPLPRLHVLGVATSADRAAPDRALLRTLQAHAPAGLRVDLLDAAALRSVPLGEVLADHDLVLVATSDGSEPEPVLRWAGSQGAASPLRRVPVAVVRASGGRMSESPGPRAEGSETAGDRLRRAFGEAGACVVPRQDCLYDPADVPALARLAEDLRRWVRDHGCGSVLAALAKPSP
ncbi:hypothetical protein [Rubrivirga sp.]|uniref:hypothetical protein n=1 Tax=Rubrivirga sp. TaxID=1885344 RepID=UPI003B52A6FD